MPPKTKGERDAEAKFHVDVNKLNAHQPDLKDENADFIQRVDPTTGQVPSASTAESIAPATGTSSVTSIDAPSPYWQAALVITQQQQRLIAADQQFQEFTRIKVWPKAPRANRQSVALWEQEHGLLNMHQRVLDEALRALIRAGNAEGVRLRGPNDSFSLNPEAEVFTPGQKPEGNG